MEKLLVYKVFPDEKLIIEYLWGKATWSDYLQMKKIEVVDTLYKGSYNVVTNISDVDTNYSKEMEKDILDYIHYLENERTDLDHFSSVITSSPSQYLHSNFLKMHSKRVNIRLQIFSTFEAAFRWAQIHSNKYDYISFEFESIKKLVVTL